MTDRYEGKTVCLYAATMENGGACEVWVATKKKRKALKKKLDSQKDKHQNVTFKW